MDRNKLIEILRKQISISIINMPAFPREKILTAMWEAYQLGQEESYKSGLPDNNKYG